MSVSIFRLSVTFCVVLVAFAGVTVAQEAKSDAEAVPDKKPNSTLQRFYLRQRFQPSIDAKAVIRDRIKDQVEIASSYFEIVGQEWIPTEEVDSSLISNYWIGVQCEPAGSVTFSPKEVPDAELTIDGGMKILAVTEGSAAEESGLEEGDVLLKFAANQMNTLNDLYAVIGETENNEASIVVVRDGELVSMQIKPQQRPQETDETEGMDQSPKMELQKISLKSIEDAFQQEFQNKQLPEGYRLQFELVRGKDIMLKVTKGDETWNASDDSLDDLPEPVRAVASDVVEKCRPMVAVNQQQSWVLTWQAMHLSLIHISEPTRPY